MILLRGRYIPNRVYWLPGLPRNSMLDEEGQLVSDLNMVIVNRNSFISQYSHAALLSYCTADLREKMTDVCSHHRSSTWAASMP